MSLISTTCRSTAASEANPWARRVLLELEQSGIGYCVLRGGDRLGTESEKEEVDVLVGPADLSRLRKLLKTRGFVELRVWGHAPHHFFVAYDTESHRWLKLDIVTRIAYGRPNHALVTELGEECLRRRHKSAGIYVPPPDMEWITLLLHCILDKQTFSADWRQRLTELSLHSKHDDSLVEFVRSYWSTSMTPGELRADVLAGRWDSLLSARQTVARRLQQRHRVRTAVSRLRDPLLRKLHRVYRFFRPQAISVAILAPDGAGKSTLASGIVEHFMFPVEQIYMGLYQKKAGQGSTRSFGLPGKILTQWRRYWSAQCCKARGQFVIFDRYTYDALLPSQLRMTLWRRIRRWLLAHACPSPDLIVLLDAPGELLFARKHEHSPEHLERHRQAYLALQSRFPRMVVLDAAREAALVRHDVVALMWQTFARTATAA